MVQITLNCQSPVSREGMRAGGWLSTRCWYHLHSYKNTNQVYRNCGEVSHTKATDKFSILRQTAKHSHLLGNWGRFINVSKPWVPLEQST